MAVLNDYECLAHGTYESFEPRCPYGCSKSFQKLVFLKPVGTTSARTQFQDRETRAMADSFGMTNVKSSPDGESVMQTMRRTQPLTGEAKWLPDIPRPKAGWSYGKDFLKANAEAPKWSPGIDAPRGLDPESGSFKDVIKPPQANTVFVGRPKP